MAIQSLITLLLLVCITILFIVSTSNAFILADGSSNYHINAPSSHLNKNLQQMSLFRTNSKYYHTNQGDGLKQHRRWLVVDFDGTCTEKDTTPLLPYLAAAGDVYGYTLTNTVSCCILVSTGV